ncbi:septation ring formation regulator EzrA [Erysipelothrix urinaevulpis]|uniref:septation ring formation regulator EzrA n=1 Tax=Erysipelothrix urinaevulpis TaxID=2683717 RepID=UPI00135B9848|nr:septation ring formation regulator EzrA [Erysipelothrix urinaevulpis]
MNYNDILKFLNEQKIIIAIVVGLLLVLVFMLIRQRKKKQLSNRFDELEVKYNELMSIPILFKINKATGLAKVNHKIARDVDSCKDDFESIRSKQDNIVNQMGDANDALAYGKYKEASYLFEELEIVLDEALKGTYILDQQLETLLEEETQQRMKINSLKDKFRALKTEMKGKESKLGDSYETLEAQGSEIEHMFSTFEEWMYASDFGKAAQVSEDTELEIKLFEDRLNSIPKLYERAKGLIPQLLDEVSRLYQGVRQEGVFIDHLEVPRNIALLSEVLKEDLIQIANGEIISTSKSLAESQKRLEQMVLEIQKENKANVELEELFEVSSDSLSGLTQGLNEIKHEAARIEVRFGFAGFEEQLDETAKTLADYNDKHQKISRMKNEENIPASSILVSVKELKQDVNILLEDFNGLQEKVEQANADEVRAKKQLLKLHLIINDVQVRIKKRSLPSVSQKYQSDLHKAYNYTDQIKEMLDQESLDVSLLNATVDEAIDYIYKLHNNVNNLVGVVDMSENAIVYANRYRPYIGDIDTQLTRAELAFNNGEYTQSLTTIINSIDKYRPDSEYEEMIKNNAKSAQ